MLIKKPRKLKKIEDEEWREVPNSNKRYFVSNYGRVKSFAYDKKEGNILKTYEIKGFKIVPMNIQKLKKKIFIHKLVAEVWHGKPSENHTFVTHLDGNLKNNHASNLEWHTKESLIEIHREISKLKNKSGNQPRKINNSKLKASDVVQLKSMLQRGIVQAKIAKLFSISEMQVTRIKRGENWSHIVLE